MRRRGFCIGVVGGLGVLAWPARVQAAPVEVEVVLASPRTQVGRGVYMQVVVTAEGDQEPGDPELPELPGLEIGVQGTSFQSSMSFGTGQQMIRQTSKTHEYLLLPTRPGRYVLDVGIVAGGKRIVPAHVPVLEVSGDAVDDAPAQAARPGARPTSADDEVFLWPTVDRRTVYVGEPLLYRLEIWERANADVQLRNMPAFDDFWVEELDAGQRRRDAVDGVPYRVHPLLERVLFPQKAGELTLGGGEVVVTPHGGFGLLRPRRSQPPYQVVGSPLNIEVLALPADGQPPGFRANNVGRFSIETSVDRHEVAQGEAFTLTVTLTGIGNVRFVEPGPWPSLSGLRRYEPKEELQLDSADGEIRGTRRYTFLIVAQQAGDHQIPAHTLSFFDPRTREYAVSESAAIHVRVTPDPEAAPPEPPALEDPGSEQEDELLADVFATDVLPRVEPRASWLTPARWTSGVLAVPAALALGVGGRTLVRRLAGDERARARARQAAQRRAWVDQASRAVDSGEGFFPAVAALLHTVAVERAGSAGVGLPRERLLVLLRRQGVAERELEAMRRLLDDCDAARFGAGASDPGSRRALLQSALALIDTPAWEARVR